MASAIRGRDLMIVSFFSVASIALHGSVEQFIEEERAEHAA